MSSADQGGLKGASANEGGAKTDDPSDSNLSDLKMRLIVCEDNEVVIKIVSKQRSMALRHVSRTHRVCLDWTFEVMQSETVSMRYVNTKFQIADMMTKAFTKKDTWNTLLELSAIGRPVEYLNVARAPKKSETCVAYSMIALCSLGETLAGISVHFVLV